MNNNKYKILVVENEKKSQSALSALLESSGYQVISAGSCKTGLLLFSSHCPNLILLGLGLSDTDGMVLLKEIRKTSLTPIIIVSSRTSEESIVKALDAGANDYVSKPFGKLELLARIRAALRSTRYLLEGANSPEGTFQTGSFFIDYDARKVSIYQRVVKLTQTEYNIIALLSKHCDKVLTYSFICKSVWGYNDFGSRKKLQVNMANIRKKFSLHPGEKEYITNVPGIGYQLEKK